MDQTNCIGFIKAKRQISTEGTADAPAVLIAPDLVLTAAQNLCHPDDLHHNDELIFYPQSRYLHQKPCKISRCLISKEFKLHSDSVNDLALLRLEEKMLEK